MSQPVPNTALSQSARLLCYLGPPSAILLTSIASPRTALLAPLSFLPTTLFYRRWRDANNVNRSRRAELEPLIWTYTATGTVGLATTALIQLLVCYGASILLFGSGQARQDLWREFQRGTMAGLSTEELMRRAELAGLWQTWVFNGLLTFVAAGLAEEALKYLPIAYARRRGTAEQRQPRKRAYLDYALAGALSFGVVENIGFLYVACEKSQETGPKVVLTVIERVLLGAGGHLLMAALTALRAIRRDYYGEPLSWWAVVGPSALLHGAFDFVALSFSALEGHVGWIHPVEARHNIPMAGLLAGLIATAAWEVRRNWMILNDRDRSRE